MHRQRRRRYSQISIKPMPNNFSLSTRSFLFDETVSGVPL